VNIKVVKSKGHSSSSTKREQKLNNKNKSQPKEPPETSHASPTCSPSQLETIPEEHEPSDPEPVDSNTSRADSSKDIPQSSQRKRKQADFMNEPSSFKELAKKKRPKPADEHSEPSMSKEKQGKPRLVDKPRRPTVADAKTPSNAQAGPSSKRIFSSPPKLPSVKWRNPLQEAKLGFPPLLMGSPLKAPHGDDELDIL